jgi:heat-inducible transcriptional repressor
MAVVVLTDGTVVERHLDPSAINRVAGGPASQEDLDGAAAELNAELKGLTAPQARRRAGKLNPLAAHVAAAVAELLEEADGTAIEDVYTDGLAYVLDQPEFAGGHALRPVLEILQRVDFLEQLLPVVTRRGGVHVIIGRENPNDAMREVSLVFAPYGTPGRAMGLLGVLGPTRMAYPRAIPTVRFVSSVLNELIDSHAGWTHD